MNPAEIVAELVRLADQNARLEAEVAKLREERIPQVDRSSKRRDRRLTIAYFFMVIVALGLAGAGTASALEGSNTVYTDDIVDGAVRTVDIRDGAVASRDLLDGTVAAVDVADGSLFGADVADGSLSGADVADGSLSGADAADGSIGGVDIADGSISGADINLYFDDECTLETIQGTALVNADAAVPSTYTTNWLGYTHSCTGSQVRVKRFSKGSYVVDFGYGHPAKLIMVTPVATQGVIAFASARENGLGDFVVGITDQNGSAIDADFQLLIY